MRPDTSGDARNEVTNMKDMELYMMPMLSWMPSDRQRRVLHGKSRYRDMR